MNPTTDEEFEAALQRLLRAAYRNGVSVEGAWVGRNDDRPDWEAVVPELEKREPAPTGGASDGFARSRRI